MSFRQTHPSIDIPVEVLAHQCPDVALCRCVDAVVCILSFKGYNITPACHKVADVCPSSSSTGARCLSCHPATWLMTEQSQLARDQMCVGTSCDNQGCLVVFFHVVSRLGSRSQHLFNVIRVIAIIILEDFPKTF